MQEEDAMETEGGGKEETQMTDANNGTAPSNSKAEDLAPNQTLYINNLNERIKKDGKINELIFFCKIFC